MTERLVRPIRAWAEYDEWSVYLEDYDGEWVNVHIPKGNNDWSYERGVYDGIADFATNLQVVRLGFGSLRSLRVLYENGHELQLEQWHKDLNDSNVWPWILRDRNHDAQADGQFTEDKDSDAVERALIAAAAWFTQAEVPV